MNSLLRAVVPFLISTCSSIIVLADVPPASVTATTPVPSASTSETSKSNPAGDTKENKKSAVAQVSTATSDTSSSNNPKNPKTPRVRAGDQLSVELPDLAEKIKQNPDFTKNARLLLNCKRIADLPADCVIGNTLLFTITRETIEQITPRTKVVPISLSADNGKTIISALPDHVQLVMIAYDGRFFAVIGILFVGALLLFLYGRYTNLLRDGKPPDKTAAQSNPTTFNVLCFLPGFEKSMPNRGQLSAYSLAKVQMASWSFIVAGSFLFIWLAIGEINSITSSAVILLGISLGTTVASRMVAGSKQATAQDLKAKQDALKTQVDQLQTATTEAPVTTAEAATSVTTLTQNLAAKTTELNQTNAQLNQLTTTDPADAKSSGFLTDIMSDENGISIHRFQMVGWTVVLTVIFVCGVFANLTMPQFSDQLLTLMGISSGTYVALKIPEKKSVVAPQ